MRKIGLDSETADTDETVETIEVVKAAETAETTGNAEITGSYKRIYIGPTLKGVTNGTVFNGDLPPMLQEAIKDIPAIGELVVPVTNLTAANKELANPKSALSRFWGLVKKSKGEKRS